MEVFAFSSNRISCIHMEGLIPLKSSIDQAMVSLCFLRISGCFFSLCFVKLADIIIGLDFSASRKAYFKCSSNSFRIKPYVLVFTSDDKPPPLLAGDVPATPQNSQPILLMTRESCEAKSCCLFKTHIKIFFSKLIIL